MSASFPNGTLLAVSTAYGTVSQISNISNANPAVATATNLPSENDIGVLVSGYTDISDRVFRAVNASGTAFTLDGVDTTDVSRFPAATGAGTFTPVESWVQLSQVREFTKSGGEQQFFTWQYLEDRSGRQRQRPTYKNAKSIAVTLDYDPALAWYQALAAADATKDPVVLRATLPNNAELYYYVYPSFDADPSLTLNENMTNSATFSLIGDLTRYDAVSGS